MAVLNDLIAQIENAELRRRIEAEVERMNKQKKFGLVFEDHLPECTPLYDIPVKVGSSVALRAGQVNEVYKVLKIEGEEASCVKKDGSEVVTFAVNDLVSVAEFGEAIYPYLKPLDSVCNAPDSDLWHTLIEADNYHALQLLEYLYAGKVDCIYIDPPYNTGARDWKYNNDYVDGADAYRHSKWLSFMEKRLKLAKKLLNPSNSVLIITIDEKEYLHLGCLLEEMFPEARMQMISSVINHAGTGGVDIFGRTNEFIYFLMFGDAKVSPQEIVESDGQEVAWDSLRRHNPANLRPTRPSQFYPIYINKTTGRIEKIGDPITPDVDRFSVPAMENCETVFPVKDNGVEMMWGIVPEEARRRNAGGYIKVGKYSPDKPQQYSLQFLSSGTIEAIEKGTVKVTGHRKDGSVIAVYSGQKKILPKTQWDKDTHDATHYGTKMLKTILGGRFNYPKSVYAVLDCIRYFLDEKKDALVVDFFAGSGTTLHALNLLNEEDGGHRRCIIVTNNEVSVEESKMLSEKGLRPGDEEWNRLGIARYVTWPRTVCTIQGVDIHGKRLSGEYLNVKKPMGDGFDTNAIFFKLGFLDKNAVALGRQFMELLPVLWMKAGAIGECPVLEEDNPGMLVLPNNKFAVLADERRYLEFVEELDKHPEIDTVYIVTDSDRAYRDMIAFMEGKTTYQLYRDYLDNFRINSVRR